EKEIIFNDGFKVLESLQKKIKLSDHQLKRIKRFLVDETGLIFGLRFYKDKFYFLIKRGEGKLAYLVTKNTSNYTTQDILNDYLANVLRTSLSILSEAKRKEEI